jgi:four helix bundle protein
MALYAGRLWVAQTASVLADKVRHWAKGLPKEEFWTLGVQLVRSADSISANIVEGFGRRHRGDTLHFYSIALGSLEETVLWIRRANTLDLMSPILASDLIASYLKLDKSLKRFAGSPGLLARRSRP